MAVTTKHGAGGTGTGAARAREGGDGVFAVSEFLLSMVESLWQASVDGRQTRMESATKAQHELERIEQQIEQLETLAGDNQEAHRKLQQ
ncbi:MAG TPA: hypothetical protein VKR26_08635, partial [Terriglobales bacterium]|nr:hypothetical protein [Terriglobales bacterium]